MKVLNEKHRGTTWSNSKYPKLIVFDKLTQEDVPFLEFIGMAHLLKEVCDKCQKQRCICSKAKTTRKKKQQDNDITEKGQQ